MTDTERLAALRVVLVKALAEIEQYDPVNTEPGGWWDKRIEPLVQAVLAVGVRLSPDDGLRAALKLGMAVECNWMQGPDDRHCCDEHMVIRERLEALEAPAPPPTLADDEPAPGLREWLREQSAAAERMARDPRTMGPGVGPADIAWHEGAKHMADGVLTWLADHE